MEAGALFGDGYAQKWLSADKSLFLGIWAIGGEKIGTGGGFGRPRIKGFRCKKCQTIILHY
jgi:hypothetical protein